MPPEGSEKKITPKINKTTTGVLLDSSDKGFVIGCVIAVLSGIGLSLRQLYLQSLPPELVPSCAPDIDYLLNTLPFLEVLVMAITGDGNCAEVLWSFMGISIPGWTLIGFLVILIYLVKILFSANEIHSHKQN